MSRAGIGKSNPLTQQRSTWEPLEQQPPIEGAAWHLWLARRVHDGELRACIAIEPAGLHLSISHVFHAHHPTRIRPGSPVGRYPTWDEITHAREALLPEEMGFVMHLPPMEEYVAVHDTTFHLHQFPELPA